MHQNLHSLNCTVRELATRNGEKCSRRFSSQTRKCGKAKCDSRLLLSYRRRTFVTTCENFVTVATGVGYVTYVRVCTIPLHCLTSETVTSVKKMGHITYTGRVIANFVCKRRNLCYGHILLTAVLPYCKSRPITSLVHITYSE